MDELALKLDLREALELYLFLAGREEGLEGAPAGLLASIRRYLYGRLSIEEMEAPAKILESLRAEAL